MSAFPEPIKPLKKKRAEPRVFQGGGRCMCEFPSSCGGMGMLQCDGCGGDLCVCACGDPGIECEGCDDCGEGSDEIDDYGYASESGPNPGPECLES